MPDLLDCSCGTSGEPEALETNSARAADLTEPLDLTAGGCDDERPEELEPDREGVGFSVYRVLPRLTFSWGNLQQGGTLEYIIPRYMRIEADGDAQLIVRIHESAESKEGGHTVVEAQTLSWSSEEPESMFISPQPAARIRIDSNALPGTCMIARLRLDLGSHLRLKVTFTCSGAPADNLLTISADLLTRSSRVGNACSDSSTNNDEEATAWRVD
jgi:hypothetical protein